jgi:hypothetical protein
MLRAASHARTTHLDNGYLSMHTTHPPQLIDARLLTLRPTQLTVGYREVIEKRDQWKKLSKKALDDAIGSHFFPAVAGPDGDHYVIDHHHLGLALIEQGVKNVRLTVIKDLSWIEPHLFWRVMEHHQWVHPFDTQGMRQSYDALPKKLTGLVDDPYRSLAGDLRHAGGFAKDATPFSEFLWADFLRGKIPAERVQTQYSKALKQALKLSRTQQARYLPGWTGAHAT